MSVGAVVWSIIGAAWAAWLVVTVAVRRLPGPVAALRVLLGSRTGRFLALAAWGAAGWHLFCQRP